MLPRMDSAFAKCPSCGLSLPDEPDQRDKRCPQCLRDRGEAVLMHPAPPSREGPGTSAGPIAA